MFYAVTDLLKGKVNLSENILVKGWVRTRRDSKAGISFIALSDGSCFDSLQVVASNTLANYENEILKLTAGCSVEIKGVLVESPAKGQAFELQANEIKVLGFVEDPDTYPMAAKHHTMEHLREYPHLRVRTNTIGAMTRVRNCLAQAIRRFFDENGFYWIHTPIVSTSDCEGAGEMLRVTSLNLEQLPKNESGKIDYTQDFFGVETFLTVSGQLNVEAYCCALSKVYTFGPTFRAENSNTARHLAEFWMVEPEMAFADLNDDAALAEKFLVYLVKAVLNERQDDMAFFAKQIDKDCITRLEALLQSQFERMEYSEAIKILEKADCRFEFPVRWGIDLQSEHEKYLLQKINRPVIVMNYPKEIKSFYMRLNDDGKTVAAMDVLSPGIGEIIGGSQREERFENLKQRICEMGLDEKRYEWYLDLRRYGTVKHAGFGLGFERMVQYVTGLHNIRDVIPYPRTVKHALY